MFVASRADSVPRRTVKDYQLQLPLVASTMVNATVTPSNRPSDLRAADIASSPGQVPVQHAHARPSASVTSNTVPSGPVLGPASGPAPDNQVHSPNGRSAGGHSSLFSATRALIQDLTLPPVPNLDIPPSPPGSPDPTANAKFEHFLSLKKQGIHFNSKLASSSSLKNPSLLMKMMVHAGIGDEAQYNTTLPAELWSTSDLPEWAYKEKLLKAQQEIRQDMEEKRAAGQRSSLEFVSSSPANASRSSSSAAKRKDQP